MRTPIMAAVVAAACSFAGGRPADGAEAGIPPAEVRTERSTVSLISDRASVTAGTAFWVGLRMQLAAGWHTYWRNPGDAGNPARITWTLPDGLVAGTIRWPRPERISTGPLMSFAYEDEVVLLTRMSAFTLPAEAETVAIRAHASWLVCAEVCVPEEGDLALRLPVSAVPTAPATDSAARISHFLRQLPQSAPNGVGYRRSSAGFELAVPLPDGASAGIADLWFFPGRYGQVEHPAPQPWKEADGRLLVRLTPGDTPPGPSTPLEGVLAVRYEDGSASSWNITAAERPAE